MLMRQLHVLLSFSVVIIITYRQLKLSVTLVGSNALQHAHPDWNLSRVESDSSLISAQSSLPIIKDTHKPSSEDTSTAQGIRTQKRYWNQDVVNGTIFLCGFNRGRLPFMLFPEFPQSSWLHFKTKSDQNSLLFMAVSGPCPRHTGRYTLGHEWVRRKFKGRTLFMLGEPNDVEGETNVLKNRRSWAIGSIPDSEFSLYITFLAMVLVGTYEPKYWGMVFNHSLKPKSTLERFCIYAASNCVEYRERAADTLTQIGLVYQGGACTGKNGTRLVKMHPRQRAMQEGPADALWTYNVQVFKRYRFCLVMENSGNLKYYITEKILNAFLAGCMPIYYGTEQIFDIFNPKAFIYYNISDPKSAVERISYLESNRTALVEALLNEPILKDGEETIEQYFTLTDEIGNGTLKRRIRTMMGLSPYVYG